jgi:hypothetical protein
MHTYPQIIVNMEIQNAENRNSRVILMYSAASRPSTSIRYCSVCRNPGHNARTCVVNERNRQFELQCAISCQNMSTNEFEIWLSNTYEADFLKTYAVTKCGIINMEQDLASCIHAIRDYIYNTYMFEYADFTREMTQLFEVQHVEPIQMSATDMEATLNNDIISALYFQSLRTRILLQNYGEMMQFNPSVIQRYQIENVISEEKKEEVIECSICYDEYNWQGCVQFGCNHEFCKDCVKKSLIANPCCPMCRAPVKKMIPRTPEIHKELEELEEVEELEELVV